MNESDFVRAFRFLDSLRDSGSINMFGAAPVVSEGLGYSKAEARTLTVKWMETFDPNKTAEERAAEAVS